MPILYFMTNKNAFFSALLVAAALSYGCDSSNPNDNRVEKIDTAAVARDTSDVAEDIKKVAADLPSSVDFVSHINQADLPYEQKWLNSPVNVDKYLANSAKNALNLGVYMADLGYNALYFKPQGSLEYLKVTKKLSDQIGILNQESKAFVERFERNLEVRDSLLTITREAYFSIDEYLKGSERRDIASLMLAGTWIEGLYISSNVLSGLPNIGEDAKLKPILWRIGGQKRSLNNLISILEKNSTETVVKDLIKELKELALIYEKVKIVEANRGEVQEFIDIAEIKNLDDITDKVVLSSIVEVDIDLDTFKAITQKITSIRNKLVQ